MKINGTPVGTEETPYFIAEAGVNHNGDLDLAKRLIDIAADAGADAVKFQTFSADRLVTQDARKAKYQGETTDEDGQYEMLRQYELDRKAHEQLIEYSTGKGITFLSTPFDPESADMLADLGVPAIKVGSGELDNHPLLEHIADLDLPMIVSTGMGTMEEVNDAHGAITAANPDVDLIFLHCTSSYPAAIEDIHLRAMQTMADELTVPVGYSDHTTLPETPALAVAAGACVIEKHFTIDSTLPGPDHEASLEPDELARCIELVETAARALGDGEKHPVDAELENRAISRKSLYAATDIESGTVLSESDIKIVRPAEGLSPRELQTVLGKQVINPRAEGDPIRQNDLE
ncbi:N-acetylneuraminate synthase [Halorientalis brevis]|uniref:N-acetylneuraminate synthase n=1 Tax=Halorientalis brevis TaxID=1126241 RepID=A0ABD6C6M0_9EURY|nr:N-acetylneuraminate synthase [Halorientalis brevis]